MEQHLSGESLQLIANLINDKNDDLKEHFDVQLRMVKTTVQENHNLAVETRDLGKITNGRVNGLENEIYGFVDKNNSRISGREGLLYEVDMIKYWKWAYKSWKVPVVFIAIGFILFVDMSRDWILEFIRLIF